MVSYYESKYTSIFDTIIILFYLLLKKIMSTAVTVGIYKIKRVTVTVDKDLFTRYTCTEVSIPVFNDGGISLFCRIALTIMVR